MRPRALPRLAAALWAVACALLLAAAPAAWALPDGATPTQGQAQLAHTAPGTLQIRQTTDRAGFDWRSFHIAARSASKSAASTGNSPQNTTGCAGRKPASGVSTGFLSSVMVSPTRVSATSLIDAVKKPISPGPSSSTSTFFGLMTPTRSRS